MSAYRERYIDFGPIFAAEKLAEVEGITVCPETLRQWLIVCGKLGIELIAANSPQSKCRSGRNHGVCHDRFVKELRRAGISSIEEANRFLEQRYLRRINRKFVRSAADPADAHVPPCGGHDFAVFFQKMLFQIRPDSRPLPVPREKVREDQA